MKILKNSQLIHTCKKWGMLKREHHRCVAGQPPLKRSWVCNTWIQSTIPAEALQLGLRGNRSGMKWRKPVRPLEFQRQDIGWPNSLDVNAHRPLVTGKKDPEGGCHGHHGFKGHMPSQQDCVLLGSRGFGAQSYGKAGPLPWMVCSTEHLSQGGLFSSLEI